MIIYWVSQKRYLLYTIQRVIFALPYLVLKPEYLDALAPCITRLSAATVLTWQHRVNRSLYSTRLFFNNLHHFNGEKWQKIPITYFHISQTNPRISMTSVKTNAGILFIGPLGTNFSEILIEIQIFSFKKMHLKVSSGKWQPFSLSLNVLRKHKFLHFLESCETFSFLVPFPQHYIKPNYE